VDSEANSGVGNRVNGLGSQNDSLCLTSLNVVAPPLFVSPLVALPCIASLESPHIASFGLRAKRSSVEAEYRAMALVACELIWLKQLLKELQFGEVTQMTLICDNQAALILAQIPSITRGLNILKLIVILFEKKLHLETSRLCLLIQMIN